MTDARPAAACTLSWCGTGTRRLQRVGSNARRAFDFHWPSVTQASQLWKRARGASSYHCCGCGLCSPVSKPRSDDNEPTRRSVASGKLRLDGFSTTSCVPARPPPLSCAAVLLEFLKKFCLHLHRKFIRGGLIGQKQQPKEMTSSEWRLLFRMDHSATCAQ